MEIDEYLDHGKPSWCPLKLMPEKMKKHENGIDYEHGYIDGRNELIDEIMINRMTKYAVLKIASDIIGKEMCFEICKTRECRHNCIECRNEVSKLLDDLAEESRTEETE